MRNKNKKDKMAIKRDTLRNLVCREADLLNNRITWLLTTQTILFLAFSNFYKDLICINPCPALIISVLGMLINLSSRRSLNLSLKAVERYREIDNKLTGYDPEINSSYKEVLSKESRYIPLDYDVKKYCPEYRDFCLPWKILPYLFFGAWLLLALCVLYPYCEVLHGGLSFWQAFYKIPFSP